MIAVMFEVWTEGACRDEYLGIASQLRSALTKVDGFISVERFESLAEPGKLLCCHFGTMKMRFLPGETWRFTARRSVRDATLSSEITGCALQTSSGTTASRSDAERRATVTPRMVPWVLSINAPYRDNRAKQARQSRASRSDRALYHYMAPQYGQCRRLR